MENRGRASTVDRSEPSTGDSDVSSNLLGILSLAQAEYTSVRSLIWAVSAASFVLPLAFIRQTGESVDPTDQKFLFHELSHFVFFFWLMGQIMLVLGAYNILPVFGAPVEACRRMRLRNLVAAIAANKHGDAEIELKEIIIQGIESGNVLDKARRYSSLSLISFSVALGLFMFSKCF